MYKFSQIVLIIAVIFSAMLSSPPLITYANQALAVTTTLDTNFTLNIEQFEMGVLTDLTPPVYGTVEQVDESTIRYIPHQAGKDYFTLTLSDDLLEVAVTVLDAEAFWLGDNLYALTRIRYPEARSTYVMSVNEAGTSVGQWWDAEGNSHVMTRSADGEFATIELADAQDWQMGHGINNNGQIVGGLESNRRIVSFLIEPDGTPTIFAYQDSPSSPAYKINEAGQMVGRVADVNGTHGFLREADGTFTLFDMPLANPAKLYTWALGINNQRDIVGFYADENDQFHGFWRLPSGEFAKIDPPDAVRTRIYDINDNQVMVGEYSRGEQGSPRQSPEHLNFNPPSNVTVYYGFIRTFEGEIISFSIPEAQSTSAWGINNNGQIVGVWVDAEGYTHGYQLDILAHPYADYEPPRPAPIQLSF